MRIDDKNKVVWCSEWLMEWKESFDDKRINSILYRIARVGYGYQLEDIYGNTIDYSEWESLTKVGLIKAIVDNYEFKLEQPQKYYWRKKKEHLAWFEKIEESYLIRFKFSGEVDYHYTLGEVDSAPIQMTETEARNILKDDFDKFEKVECE